MPDKYQDEIEEILKGIEETTPLPAGRNLRQPPPPDDLPLPYAERPPEIAPSHPSSRRWRTFSPGRVALAGVALLLIGVLLRSFGLPFSWLIWVGLLGLVAGYLLFFIRPRGKNNQGQYWRGRPVESEKSSLLQRVKGWLGG